jgi:hypothetical protein
LTARDGNVKKTKKNLWPGKKPKKPLENKQNRDAVAASSRKEPLID